MRQLASSRVLYLFWLVVAPALMADITTLTFETLAEGDTVTNQFAPLGVNVSGDPMVLTAGSWLNELDFPPHSGVNLLTNASGPIILTFGPGVTSVSAWFTYTTRLTFQLFDPDGHLLAGADSADSNVGTSEQIGFVGNIGSMSVSASNDYSFTLDDLEFVTASLPEPSSLLLLIPVAALVFCRFSKNRER